MIGWVGDIEHQTLANQTFRTVLFTGAHTQLTVMRLAAREDIGREVHPTGTSSSGSRRDRLGSSSAGPRTGSTRRTTFPTIGPS